jgi:hypothetical protein
MNIEESWKRIGELGHLCGACGERCRGATGTQSMCTGGISIVEITIMIPNAPTAVREVVREYGESCSWAPERF